MGIKALYKPQRHYRIGAVHETSARRQLLPMTQLANADFIDAQLRETILGKLPEAARHSLGASARVIRFKMPTLLGAAGEAPSHLYLVAQGGIELVARRASGDEFVISRIAPGGWAK